nr:RNA exonuclease 4 [Tanacetum cinerariifolium]
MEFSESQRNKCAACYRQFNKKEHLVEHMRTSYHSVHEPMYESTGIRPEYLRDAMPLRHVQSNIQDFLCNGEPIWKIRPRGGKARILVGHGLLPKAECERVFRDHGCTICLSILSSSNALRIHHDRCQLVRGRSTTSIC